MINLAYTQHVKIDLQNFFLLFSNSLDLNKERKLALNLFTGIFLDIYRDVSL